MEDALGERAITFIMSIVVFNESYFFGESRSTAGEIKFTRAPGQKLYMKLSYKISHKMF